MEKPVKISPQSSISLAKSGLAQMESPRRTEWKAPILLHPRLIFFPKAEDYFDNLKKDLRRSRFEILFESYIFRIDSVGSEILEILVKKAKEGVRVLVTIDGFGSLADQSTIQTWCWRYGIELFIYNPSLLRLNQRNHRKMILIDRHLCYFGSLNITEEHLKWADLGYRMTVTPNEERFLRKRFFKCRREVTPSSFKIKKPRDLILKEISLRDLGKTPSKKQNKTFYFHTNENGFQRWLFMRKLSRCLRLSQHQIQLASPYFLPRGFLRRVLLHAAKKGVQVIIIIPLKSDVWPVKLASLYYLHQLAKVGIKVMGYKQRVWHGKLLMIDERCFTGSHNWNHRSFLHDLELVLEIKSPLVSSLLREYLQSIYKDSEPIEDVYPKLPTWQKILGRIFYWFRYWM